MRGKDQLYGGWRRCGVLPLMLLLAAFTSACGGSAAPDETPKADSPRVVYLSINKEDEGSARIINELTREYQAEHPGMSFSFEYVAESDLSQRIQLLAASNDLPALFSYQPGKPLQDLIRSDAALNVEEAFTSLGLMDNINPVAVDLLKSYTDGNGLYAIPLELNIEGFWYNKEIFSRYGLKEPRTWDEMLDIADKLEQSGVQPFDVAGKEKWPITRLINAYAIRVYGADVMERVDKGEIALTSPGFVEAVQTIQDMALRGYFGSRVNTVDMGSSIDLFLQGKAAMFYMGSWQLRAFNDQTRNRIGEDQIGFFSIPLVEGGAGSLDEYPINAGLTSSFSKASYTPEVGDWMKYVFERYGDRAMSELGMVTGFKVDDMPENVPPLTKLVQEKIGQVTKGALWFEARFDTGAQLAAWNNAQLLVTNPAYTADDYLTDLENAIYQDR